MTRLILTFVGLTAVSVLHSTAVDKPKPPNIVYILADDLGYGDVQ